MFKINTNILQSFALMTMRGFLLIIKFLLTLFIAHYLDFSALGIFGLLTAAGIMAPSILGFGIMYNISRHAVTKNLQAVTHDIQFYGTFISLLYIVLLAVCCVYGLMTNQLFMAIISIIIIFCEHINGDFYGLFLNLSRPFFANVIHFVRSALWAVCYMVGAYFYPELRHIDILLLFWLAGSVIAVVCYAMQFNWFTKNQITQINPSHQRIAKIINESKIIYCNGIFTTLSTYADRYIITAFLGLELTGVYIFFWQISSALYNLLSTGIIQLYRPKLVRAFRERDHSYHQLFKSCLKKSTLLASFFAITAGITLYVCLPYLHNPLIESHFNLAYWILSVLIIVMIIEVLNLLLYSSHNDLLSLKIKIIGFTATMIFNSIFIYLYNIQGAGMASLCTSCLQLLVTHYYLRKNNLYYV